MPTEFPKVTNPPIPNLLRKIFGKLQHIRGVPRLLFTLRNGFGKNPILVDTPDGLPIVIHPEDYAELMLFYFPYCTELRALFADTLLPNDIVLDLGANLGLLSLAVARFLSAEGIVVAVEPNSASFQSLEASIAYAKISQIRPIQAAIAANQGTGYLELNPNALSISAEISKQLVNNAQMIELLTIDYLAETYCAGKSPNFIKVDIEGAEVDLIPSMQALLASGKRPLLLVEYHRDKCLKRGTAPELIRENLLALGYEERLVRPKGLSYELVAAAKELIEHDNFLYATPADLAKRPRLQANW